MKLHHAAAGALALAILAPAPPAHAYDESGRLSPYEQPAQVATPLRARSSHDAQGLPVSGVQAMVAAAAARNGVPVHLAFGVIRVESRFNCRAPRTGNGEIGIGQINPRTAAAVGVTGIHDCGRNVEASMRYLRLALDRGGAGCAGVSLYNSGIYARPRCSAYGRRVLDAAH